MKNVALLFTALFLLPNAFATPTPQDSNDRFCGRLRLVPMVFTPGCLTCTPAPVMVVLDAETLFQLMPVFGGVQSVNMSLELGGHIKGVPLEIGGPRTQIVSLQQSLLSTLIAGNEYCVTGKWGEKDSLDSRAPVVSHTIDFYQITKREP